MTGRLSFFNEQAGNQECRQHEKEVNTDKPPAEGTFRRGVEKDYGDDSDCPQAVKFRNVLQAAPTEVCHPCLVLLENLGLNIVLPSLLHIALAGKSSDYSARQGGRLKHEPAFGQSTHRFDWLEVCPKPDSRSLPVYVGIIALVPVTWAALKLTGLSLVSWNWFVPGLAVCLIFTAMMLRRAGHARTSAAFETIALMAAQGTAILILQFPLIAIGYPLADRLLFKIDTMMGFDWGQFAGLFENPTAFWVISTAYFSMTWQAVLALGILCAVHQTDRAWKLVTAAFIALCISATGLIFLPADGTYVLCGLRPVNIPIAEKLCAYVPLIREISAGELTIIDRSMQLGMISAPSFHTAAAVLLTWAVWSVAWLRIPSAVINKFMIAGTIVIGSHYLIDILAGVIVAVISIHLASTCIRPPRDGRTAKP